MAVVIALSLFAGWRVFGSMQAQRHALADPERALGWRACDPQALLGLALRQLDQDDLAGAKGSANRLLACEPVEGRAFRVLGEVAHRQRQPALALQMHLLAARRAPRDIPARAWLAQHYLQKRDFATALMHIDFVLRTTPERTRGINRILKQLAPLVQDDAFADALAEVLLGDPPWRSQMLRLAGGFPDANSRIMQTLRLRGDLSQEEYAMWLDGLIAQGRWGEAYARWASDAVAPGAGLPLLYNGDFRHPPSDAGFDWRFKVVQGVSLQFSSDTNAQDGMAQFQFLGRPIQDVGLHHPLFLFPGRYRLGMRIRARNLHSGMGLQWRIECQGRAGVLADGEPLDGSFEWRESSVEFTVPPAKCPGQVLRLIKPADRTQRVEGMLWVDDVSIRQFELS
ncbi:tetratricopeptide repeat protein [Thermomonas carbonis]|uniref:Uncharacterized protein n=1 Tax=Thermomonas carbonis TaxID=1463158 RepID=A0A7G9SN21_9GAMM|nr:hypothetical protein [Thermomonas carbonis]QNN69246.1 hypothetical protein H9L16_11240 [Thermomonas carbonis]GHC05750.1 hypothetical protein GCM10010080_19530 [Thermomonas carbonis]